MALRKHGTGSTVESGWIIARIPGIFAGESIAYGRAQEQPESYWPEARSEPSCTCASIIK
jgi:hypothetical protein